MNEFADARIILANGMLAHREEAQQMTKAALTLAQNPEFVKNVSDEEIAQIFVGFSFYISEQAKLLQQASELLIDAADIMEKS